MLNFIMQWRRCIFFQESFRRKQTKSVSFAKSMIPLMVLSWHPK